MENSVLRKRKDDLEIRDEFKLENEERRLTLRKNKINNIIFSKRKISNINENISDNIKKYKIEIKDINIPNELKIDIPQFHDKVRTYH